MIPEALSGDPRSQKYFLILRCCVFQCVQKQLLKLLASDLYYACSLKKKKFYLRMSLIKLKQ